jgi:hypothetical protein
VLSMRYRQQLASKTSVRKVPGSIATHAVCYIIMEKVKMNLCCHLTTDQLKFETHSSPETSCVLNMSEVMDNLQDACGVKNAHICIKSC